MASLARFSGRIDLAISSIVLALRSFFSVFETGYHKYWGIEMTTMKNPPIVEGETGSYD